MLSALKSGRVRYLLSDVDEPGPSVQARPKCNQILGSKMNPQRSVITLDPRH
jgi:hypothetical protein